jgi:urea transport system substrate-binding protein
MEAGYMNVNVWALAVEQAQSFDVEKVSFAAVGTAFDSPEGVVTLQENHHFSKYAKIGRVNAKGLFGMHRCLNRQMFFMRLLLLYFPFHGTNG